MDGSAEIPWSGRRASLAAKSWLSNCLFLKYGKLSSFLANDAVVSSFSDSAAINYKGAVALVVKLGLLEGENGKFDPQRIVTKAQAAIVIMKMVELQGKLDQPIV